MGEDERGIIEPEDPRRAVTVNILPRQFDMQLVTEAELTSYLEHYESSMSSLYPTFLSISLSSLITLALAWIASPPSGWAVAVFTGAAISLCLASAFFGAQWWRERRAAGRVRRRLSDRIAARVRQG